jgi:Uma2 family endonuclease
LEVVMSVTSAPPEERVVLRQVRWDTYERLLADHADARAPRFTYDRGTLEIMSPGSRHESFADLVRHLVAAVAEARGLDVTGLGSTTFRDPGWERGFEPDACFYLRDAATVRGLEHIDPRVDPPPEIVFEVDITRSSIDKLALYAQFGVAEVWRHDGEAAAILVLDVERHGGYERTDASRALRGLDAVTLTRLLADGLRTPLPRWLSQVRDWARTGGR